MIATESKAKQYITATLKIAILALAFGFIYFKLVDVDSVSLVKHLAVLLETKQTVFGYFFIFLLLATLNWYFEILKWKIAVQTFQKISFKTALKQSLVSLTVGLATPNRIGDYGAKAMFFPAANRKKVLLLNFLNNILQLTATILFGIIGLVWLFLNFELRLKSFYLLLIFILFFTSLALLFIFRKKTLLIKGFTVIKVFTFYKKIKNAVIFKLFVLSVLRYITFSALFCILLFFFGIEESIFSVLMLIFSMYVLVSIIPTFFIFDVVVRGGVAVWLFGLIGVANLAVFCTVLIMWILNFVLPAICGGFYVVDHKFKTI